MPPEYLYPLNLSRSSETAFTRVVIPSNLDLTKSAKYQCTKMFSKVFRNKSQNNNLSGL